MSDDIIKLTAPDGIPVYIAKPQIVSWKIDPERPTCVRITLQNGFQVVKEKPDEVLKLYG